MRVQAIKQKIAKVAIGRVLDGKFEYKNYWERNEPSFVTGI